MRKIGLGLLCAVGLWAQTTPAARPGKPKLVVAIVVDQFRYDYLTRFEDEFKGGLKRLWTKGAVWTNAGYNHAPTVTAVGHSIVLSGAMPAASGIVGNEWYDRGTAKMVTSVSDPNVKLLGAEGTASSPHRLLVSTLGDEMKLGTRPAKVVGVSIKDRSAIMPSGHLADGAYWFDKKQGYFVSSTFYFAELPGWVKEFNAKRGIDEWKGAQTYGQLSEGLYGNDVVELFAEAAIEGEKLGHGAGTDLLTMSFSANDSVGHAKGPHSKEAHEITLRTDAVLERFFSYVDKKVGLQNTLFVLTADHGAAPVPELMQEKKMPGGRIAPAALLDAMAKALNDKYGEAKWILARDADGPYLDHKLIADSRLDLAEVQQTAARAARGVAHVARVYTSEELRTGQVPEDKFAQRVSNGFFAPRGPDLVIVPEPYYLIGGTAGGTSHGTPWNYDAHVPVVFYGPWVKAGKYHQPALVNDIAPTLATLLEVEIPSGSVGRVLTEMLNR